MIGSLSAICHGHGTWSCKPSKNFLTRSDVFFQLAFGAYVGAFFNLNPFLDRDGYQILVDWLREPGLRQRARQQFARKLSGAAPDEETSPVLARYALAGVLWSAIGVMPAMGSTLPVKRERTQPREREER